LRREWRARWLWGRGRLLCDRRRGCGGARVSAEQGADHVAQDARRLQRLFAHAALKGAECPPFSTPSLAYHSVRTIPIYIHTHTPIYIYHIYIAIYI